MIDNNIFVMHQKKNMGLLAAPNNRLGRFQIQFCLSYILF